VNSREKTVRRLSAEPLLWGGWNLFTVVARKLKSKFLSWIFHAPGLYLGPGCIIRGSKCIAFGSGIYIHGHLWLEAIESYRDQWLTPRIEIGDETSFSENVHISCIERIVIGRHVLFGSGVYISDHGHGVYNGAMQSHPAEPPIRRMLGGGGPVTIGDNVWLGDHVVVVGPVTIGPGAIVGANSVVRGDVPANTIVVGSPARAIKKFNEAVSQWEKP
jgi:acetyltransferase-like isoleucine patch superfamily enzyme